MKVTYDARQLRNAMTEINEKSTLGKAFLELAKRDFDEVFGPRVPKNDREEFYFLLKAFFLTFEDVTLDDNDDGDTSTDEMVIAATDYQRPYFEVDEEEEVDGVDLSGGSFNGSGVVNG